MVRPRPAQQWVAVAGDPTKGSRRLAVAGRGDSDPTLFLHTSVAALQTIAADIEKVLGMLHTSQPQPPPTESILTAFA